MSEASSRATIDALLALMADSTGSEMVHLMFGDDPVPMQLLAAKQWSQELANAIDTAKGSPGSQSSASSRIDIPMDCSKADWLLAMSFCYPTRPPSEVTWKDLEPLMKLAHKYNMPAIMDRCEKFLMSNLDDFDNKPSSLKFGLKWIALADTLGQEQLAKACFDAKRLDTPFAVALSTDEDILNSLSPGLTRHILVTYAKQQVGPGQLHCKKCERATNLLTRESHGYVQRSQFTELNDRINHVEYKYPVICCSNCFTNLVELAKR